MHVWRQRKRGEVTRCPGFEDDDAEGLVARGDAEGMAWSHWRWRSELGVGLETSRPLAMTKIVVGAYL
eukprot:1599993-Rhodomonas_salina.1